MKVLMLSEADVRELLDLAQLLDALEEGVGAGSGGYEGARRVSWRGML